MFRRVCVYIYKYTHTYIYIYICNIGIYIYIPIYYKGAREDGCSVHRQTLGLKMSGYYCFGCDREDDKSCKPKHVLCFVWFILHVISIIVVTITGLIVCTSAIDNYYYQQHQRC